MGVIFVFLDLQNAGHLLQTLDGRFGNIAQIEHARHDHIVFVPYDTALLRGECPHFIAFHGAFGNGGVHVDEHARSLHALRIHIADSLFPQGVSGSIGERAGNRCFPRQPSRILCNESDSGLIQRCEFMALSARSGTDHRKQTGR